MIYIGRDVEGNLYPLPDIDGTLAQITKSLRDRAVAHNAVLFKEMAGEGLIVKQGSAKISAHTFL